VTLTLSLLRVKNDTLMKSMSAGLGYCRPWRVVVEAAVFSRWVAKFSAMKMEMAGCCKLSVLTYKTALSHLDSSVFGKVTSECRTKSQYRD